MKVLQNSQNILGKKSVQVTEWEILERRYFPTSSEVTPLREASICTCPRTTIKPHNGHPVPDQLSTNQFIIRRPHSPDTIYCRLQVLEFDIVAPSRQNQYRAY